MEPLLFVAILLLLIAAITLAQFFLTDKMTSGRAYNAEYDAIIRRLLDVGAIKRTSDHRAKAGDLTIWIANYPYAFGHPYDCDHDESLMPSRKTRRRLFKEMRRQSIEAIARSAFPTTDDSKEAGQ